MIKTSCNSETRTDPAEMGFILNSLDPSRRCGAPGGPLGGTPPGPRSFPSPRPTWIDNREITVIIILSRDKIEKKVFKEI